MVQNYKNCAKPRDTHQEGKSNAQTEEDTCLLWLGDEL